MFKGCLRHKLFNWRLTPPDFLIIHRNARWTTSKLRRRTEEELWLKWSVPTCVCTEGGGRLHTGSWHSCNVLAVYLRNHQLTRVTPADWKLAIKWMHVYVCVHAVVVVVGRLCVVWAATKSGQCPSRREDTTAACVVQCTTDNHCLGQQKCCSNGCSRTCHDPG